MRVLNNPLTMDCIPPDSVRSRPDMSDSWMSPVPTPPPPPAAAAAPEDVLAKAACPNASSGCTGSSMVVASASGSRKYFCSRLSATMQGQVNTGRHVIHHIVN